MSPLDPISGKVRWLEEPHIYALHICGRNRGKERPVYILSDKPINKGILVIRNIIKIMFICSLNC